MSSLKLFCMPGESLLYCTVLAWFNFNHVGWLGSIKWAGLAQYVQHSHCTFIKPYCSKLHHLASV